MFTHPYKKRGVILLQALREQKELSVSSAEKPGEDTETIVAVAEFPDASAKLTKAENRRLERQARREERYVVFFPILSIGL